MKMWRPEATVQGPRIATPEDVPALNRIFSDAFTDRYRRDGLVGVRVPQLNPVIWRYAIEDAGAGAMRWDDERGAMLAFNIAHHSGTEGWMGPLAVRNDRQGLGVGRVIVETAIAWLREQGVRTLGLETMPRTVENIGFYSKLGFVPQHLTVTLTGEVTQRAVRGRFILLSQTKSAQRQELIERCRRRLDQSAPGYDFSREFELTLALRIGDGVVVEREDTIAGFALWHSAALADARPADELRVLKLYADSDGAFDRLIVALESCAAKHKIRRVAMRCQTAFRRAYQQLIARDYRVRWTDLRMTLQGFPEAVLPEGEVLFSNWEI